MEDEKFELIDSGVKLIKSFIKDIKKPADKNSLLEIKEGTALLEKKFKLMQKDDALRIQYVDRTMFDTIQGVFQVLHLYIISNDGESKILEAADWLRSHENCYSIADRMQKAALARADFSGAGKTK